MSGGRKISVPNPEATKAKLQAIADAIQRLPDEDALVRRRGPRAQHSSFVAAYDESSWERYKEAIEKVLKLKWNIGQIIEGAQDVVDQMVKQDEELEAELRKLSTQMGSSASSHASLNLGGLLGGGPKP